MNFPVRSHLGESTISAPHPKNENGWLPLKNSANIMSYSVRIVKFNGINSMISVNRDVK
ncbi:MAG: hypothetical protein Kow0042_11040 [Calditrichia bacterium]